MSGYIQIADDPTNWWLAQPIQASQLTGQPLSVQVTAPVAGTLVLSPAAASVAIINPPSGQAAPAALELQAPAIYVPTATGPSAGNVGYELPTSVNLATLASQITALMSGGGSQTITLGTASGGTVVLNGATLSFVVLCQATTSTTSGGLTGSPAGSIPHDSIPSD